MAIGPTGARIVSNLQEAFAIAAVQYQARLSTEPCGVEAAADWNAELKVAC